LLSLDSHRIKDGIRHVLTPTEHKAFLASPAFDDDGLAAKQHLAFGRPIYYGDDRYPNGLVKKYPGSRKQLVKVSSSGEISVIRDL